MDAGQDPPFVNRTRELTLLSSLLPPASTQPALAVLCSPPGFGKSRLTDELAERIRAQGLACAVVVVDPLIRSGGGRTAIYDGYFIQQCAKALDAAAQSGGGLEPFADFLKSRRWTSVRNRKLGDAIQKLPSWENAYSLAFEYLERALVFGRHGAEQLLASDTRDAVAACQAYLDHIARTTDMVLTIRQAEHLDHESLKTLLDLSRTARGNLVVLEFTSPDGALPNDHEKLLVRELRTHPNAHIEHLVELSPEHLDLILRALDLPSQMIELRTTGYWNGNLRQLETLRREARFTVQFDARSAPLLLEGPIDLKGALNRQIEALGATARLLFAIVAAHPDPIPRAVLFEVARRLAPHETDYDLNEAVRGLIDDEQLLASHFDSLALRHDDLARDLDTAPVGFGAASHLAQAALRDFYLGAFKAGGDAVVAHTIALRRALMLSARTEDPQQVLALLDDVEAALPGANDQGVYVDVIVELVENGPSLLASERRRITTWAAYLAYDVCDFRRCRGLLETLEQPTDLDRIILAHCLIEQGEHAAARRVGDALDAGDEVHLHRDLIEGAIGLDGGDWDLGRNRLEAVAAKGMATRSPLVGQALRLLSEMLGPREATTTALASVDWFKACALPRCAAYSALSASRFLARQGDIVQARALVDEAAETLRAFIRDEHIVRNNRCLVELLSPQPDFARCVGDLQVAMRSSRDDFCDLVILTNLAIAHAGLGDLAAGLDCVARASAILDDPGFVERDVLWPVCFSLTWVLTRADRGEEAAAMLRRPGAAGWTVRGDDAYWAFRYGETAIPDPDRVFLYGFPYHPVALSHWQLDREAAGSPR